MTPNEIKAIIAEKVTGKWNPEHTDNGHFYRNGDVLLSSVTSILTLLSKPHLVPWSAKMALEYLIPRMKDYLHADEVGKERIFKEAQFAYTNIRDESGSIGSFTHAIAEVYLLDWIKNGKPVDDIKKFIPENADGKVFAGARSVEMLFQKHNYIPIASELLVGSKEVGSAGTLDMLVLDGEDLVLLDWKTSNAYAEDSYTLQVSAYSKFFEEMTELKISKAVVVMLSKDYAKITEYELIDIDGTYEQFKNLVSIYNWKNKKGNKSTDGKKRMSI